MMMVAKSWSLAALVAAWLGWACTASSPAARAPAEPEARVASAIARFNSAVGRHDFEAMADAFTEQAIWEASAGELGFRHEGRAAIRDWLRNNPGRVEVLFYQAGPSDIQVREPGRAQAKTSVMELLRFLPSGELRQLFGVYADDLVEEAGRFRFERRRFELRHEVRLGGGDDR